MSSDVIHSMRRQYIQVVNHCLINKGQWAKACSIISFLGALAPGLASAQNVQDFIVDPNPPLPSPFYEKSIGYYTSTTIPSVVLGTSDGMVLYTTSGDLSGPWTQTVIDPTGRFYERARPFLYPGDTYPGIMVSRSDQLVWYYNPLNWGGDPTQPWLSQVINQNAGCHDLHVVDLDGDGNPDVVCSATLFEGSQSFIAYQNAYNSWQIVTNPFLDPSGNGIGDSVALASIGGSDRINVVGATPNGVYWFRNPGSNRSRRWWPHLIGTAGNTNDVGETAIGIVPYGGSSDAIIVGSGEELNGGWPPGLVAFTSTDNGISWSAASLDTTYRAIHEINGGNELGPFFIVAEQEQVALGCNGSGFNEHPADDPACRVTLFQYQAGVFDPTLELSSLGTHNQAYVPYGNGIAVVGANHNLYGATDPALHIWFVTP